MVVIVVILALCLFAAVLTLFVVYRRYRTALKSLDSLVASVKVYKEKVDDGFKVLAERYQNAQLMYQKSQTMYELINTRYSEALADINVLREQKEDLEKSIMKYKKRKVKDAS